MAKSYHAPSHLLSKTREFFIWQQMLLMRDGSCAIQIARKNGVKKGKVYGRVKRGYPIEIAVLPIVLRQGNTPTKVFQRRILEKYKHLLASEDKP